MKQLNLAVVSCLFLLSACAGSDHAVIVDACVEQGESKESCTCAADLAKEKLSPETFATMGKIARAGEESSAEFLQNMGIADAVALAAVAVEAGQTCKISGLDGLLP